MQRTFLSLLTVSLLAFILSLSSCGCYGKRDSGTVVKQDRAVSSFSKLRVKGIFPVMISQDGGPEWVKVEADENLQELIEIESDGGELLVSSEDNVSIRKSKKLMVYVNVRQLHRLENTSVGTITTNGALKIDSLEINSESVGKLKLNLEGKFLRLNLNSVGVTELAGLVEEVRINNKSVGALHAYNLKAGTLMIHNTAVGLAEVYADKEFYIRSSAIGNLYYKGPGELKEVKHEGIGKVERAEPENTY